MKRTASIFGLGVLTLSLSGCAISGALFKAIFLRSGAPSRGEIRAMEAREEILLRELPDRTILVLPVGILNVDATYRVEAAEDLASLLRDPGFPGARAGSRVCSLPYPRQPNQAWIYWRRFRALSDSIQASRPGEADYLLFMDVMGGTNDDGSLRGLGGIHVFGFTGHGEMAYGRLRYSLHRIFKEMEPKTLMDACALAAQDMVDSRAKGQGR